jgi:hypothetical protein
MSISHQTPIIRRPDGELGSVMNLRVIPPC